TYPVGWSVIFTPVWDLDDADNVVDVSSTVVPVNLETVHIICGTPYVHLENEDCCPLSNLWPDEPDECAPDTHDLRSLWFATKEEAENHERYTMNRYRNPQPWESFIRL
ncbi:MAG: hypothetical protein ACREQ3_21550, partial [Candidatus Binatia bacterium]